MRSLSLALAALLVGCGASSMPSTTARLTSPGSVVPSCPSNLAVDGAREADVDAFTGKEVARVCVVGAKDTATVESLVIRQGERVTRERIRGDLSAILQHGFDDASVYVTTSPDPASVVLVYRVRPRPRIAEVRVSGPIFDRSVRDDLARLEGRPYQPAELHVLAQAARDACILQGYPDCAMSVGSDRVADDRIVVRVAIEPGRRALVARVEFRGNKRISSAELLEASGLRVGEPYARAFVQQASVKLSQQYFNRGFPEHTVAIEYDDADPFARGLTFVVHEGPMFTLKALHVTNLGAPQEKLLLSQVLRERPGQPLSMTALAEDAERLRIWFEEHHALVRVVRSTEVDRQKKVVVTFEVVSMMFEVAPE